MKPAEVTTKVDPEDAAEVDKLFDTKPEAMEERVSFLKFLIKIPEKFLITKIYALKSLAKITLRM